MNPQHAFMYIWASVSIHSKSKPHFKFVSPARISLIEVEPDNAGYLNIYTLDGTYYRDGSLKGFLEMHSWLTERLGFIKVSSSSVVNVEMITMPKDMTYVSVPIAANGKKEVTVSRANRRLMKKALKF